MKIDEEDLIQAFMLIPQIQDFAHSKHSNFWFKFNENLLQIAKKFECFWDQKPNDLRDSSYLLCEAQSLFCAALILKERIDYLKSKGD